jgi:hypothetical protein
MSDPRFPLSVATLDIETLALDNRAVVTEVGIVVATLTQNESDKIQATTHSEYLIRFNALDQLARGRVMQPSTWEFHLKHSGVEGLHDQIAEGLLLDADASVVNLNHIQNVVAGISEIWINGLSFDPVILSTLAKDYGYTTSFAMNRLWHYSKERDVRTLNKTIPSLNAAKVASLHRALDDAKWNLDVVVNYYNLLARLQPVVPDSGTTPGVNPA